jgi:hypothetical protein
MEQKIIDTYTYYLIIEYRNGSVCHIKQDTDYNRIKSLFDSIIEDQVKYDIAKHLTYKLIKISPEFV